jgi:hypothetical protein
VYLCTDLFWQSGTERPLILYSIAFARAKKKLKLNFLLAHLFVGNLEKYRKDFLKNKFYGKK